MKHDVFYQAMLARDYRFDGKFFVGVKTTGIYCRPICPARPKRENVEFYLSATAAERAGFRPCLRCRPESAPLSPAWNGKSAVVQRALRVIASDGYFGANEDQFAGQFGVTARHLRRIFVNEVGQTPKQIAFNNRLNFARKLIIESNLPMTSVALTAGFSSLRRFNDAFKNRFHRAPTALRKKSADADGAIELSLSYRPPFDWANLLSYYSNHLIAGLEETKDSVYLRIFKIGNSVGHLTVTPKPGRHALSLRVVTDDPTILFAVTQRVRRMFDLDSDPLLVANSFQAEKSLDQLWRKYPGLRVASGWDPFEMSVCAILGQLVSLSQARALVHQLVEGYGAKISHPVTGVDVHLFPSAAVLARVSLDKVRTSGARKKAIRHLARLVEEGKLDLTTPQDPEFMREALLSVPGIGPWSAEYIILRALGNADAFPATDLILKRALAQHADLNLNSVRPWRSYAAVYLWRHYAGTLAKQKGSEQMSYVYKTMESPVGRLTLIASDKGLAAVLWENDKPERVKVSATERSDSHKILLQAEKELNEYFAGHRKTFSVKLDFTGTDFQKKVWTALLTIPYGETRSYGQIAKQLGRHKSSRAVGAANGKNPISILAPCHRVIGASGALTGFAGGLAAKITLLKLEGHSGIG